jgi:diguanylate cyclase (GGDEF)-like protein
MSDGMDTILVIDDTKTNIDILLELLSDSYDVLVAVDYKSAFEILEDEHVDLILLDIVMPEIDGFEVCKRLKEHKLFCDIPVIFITVKADEESIEKAYDIGGSDYITKPFKVKELLARINRELKINNLINNLEYISSHDIMTGIYNRRKFFELAQDRFYYGDKSTLYAIMVDIDRFKSINDTFGHACGDAVIKATTKAISDSLNEDDIIGRLGGEEFAIILNRESTIDLIEEIEKIRKIIESMKGKSDNNQTIRFTVSFGISKYDPIIDNMDRLLKRADIALYEAKNSGRNKVIYI